MTAGRLVGAGAAAALRAPALRVLASLRQALYLDSPDGVVALVGPDVPRGPLHLVLDAPPPASPPGTPVAWTNEELIINGSVIAMSSVHEWRGPLPEPEALPAAVDLLRSLVAPAARGSSLLQPPFSDRVAPVPAMLDDGDLAGALDRLAGLGPGFTPAGDDATAGLLFLKRAFEGPAADRRLLVLARRAPVGRVSQGLLDWAARGQTVSPAHDMLIAAVDCDERAAWEAATRLAGLGASSGADFLLGLQWGLDAWSIALSRPPDGRAGSWPSVSVASSGRHSRG